MGTAIAISQVLTIMSAAHRFQSIKRLKLIFVFFFVLVSSSELLQLPDLEILEIRGTGSNRNLIFDINETMPKIKYANFELIELIADGNLNEKYSMNQQHPSDTYDYLPNNNEEKYSMHDYVPKNERSAYNVTLASEEDIEIVPYDVYVQEMHNSRRATFIGWNSLEILRIHDCQLDEVYWEMFEGLINLQHLSLENNDIKVVPPFAFYGALNLKSLSLARNTILDMNYRALAGLLELEFLDLSSNNLTKLSELTFPPFPHLKSAILRDNPIEFILPMTFGIMNGTNELSLGSESVALDLSNSNGAFLALDNLISLTLWNITASGFYQSSFTGLKSLQRLRLRGSLVNIEYDAFSEMARMAELILSECNISEISMDAFYGVKELRIIDLSSNQLTSIPPGLFDEQNQLQEIHLQKNRLTHLPKDFFSLPSLKLVRLIKNPWFCTCEMSDWKQELTNSVRVGILGKHSVDENCIRNPKTGEIQYCSGPIDRVPQYTYRFDNRMSPVCSETKKRKRSVYYALRHTIKCAAKPLKTMKRDQLKDTGMIKSGQIEELISPRPVESWATQQRMTKSQRKAQREQKIKRTMSRNAKILREEVRYQSVVDNQP